ncbi:MAG: hypothetical protein IJ083_03870 [Clostridia bacterium]|nr:hypothetical protein [Clostridia bacterium]
MEELNLHSLVGLTFDECTERLLAYGLTLSDSPSPQPGTVRLKYTQDPRGREEGTLRVVRAREGEITLARFLDASPAGTGCPPN